ncbi:DUF5348 domain-containing protein [Brevibacillus borstelensis]|uniref:DUF5348 domain-containing protein n=1 Tax=Brevibacillus borstelensis TaxID=45462 RepID=UPI001D0B678A|nr:DUF5348 domain-containing protein [Brevibacillus borstelensis]MCC0567347.1 DUF5348 domain-containing protein [Brevibacillus borstelensis]
MRYDEELDRWYVELDGRNYGLHCGECFEIYIGAQPIPCRIEMDSHWYLIIEDISFDLRRSSTYLVNV